MECQEAFDHLVSTATPEDWNAAIEKMKSENKGETPPSFFEIAIKSGLMSKKAQQFGVGDRD